MEESKEVYSYVKNKTTKEINYVPNEITTGTTIKRNKYLKIEKESPP